MARAAEVFVALIGEGVDVWRPVEAEPVNAECFRLATVTESHRGQWQIDNTSHCVRDVTFDEDRSQVRCGNIPHVMAALRNTAISLLRWVGHTNIAAACRQLAVQPAQALALMGLY